MANLARFTQIGKKVVAVGRNYAEHAAELGNAVPSKPLLFMKVMKVEVKWPLTFCLVKPPSAYIEAGQKIEIPIGCDDLHHEIELGVVINKTCKMVSEDKAMDYVGGYCLALDMTARDFQVTHMEVQSLGYTALNLEWSQEKGVALDDGQDVWHEFASECIYPRLEYS